MSPNVTFKSLLVQADLKLAVPLQAGGAWRFQEDGSRVAWQAHWGDACLAFISAKWTWQHLQAAEATEGCSQAWILMQCRGGRTGIFV